MNDYANINVHYISGKIVEGVVTLRELMDYKNELKGKAAKQLQLEIQELVKIITDNPDIRNIGKAVSEDIDDNTEYIVFLDRAYGSGELIELDLPPKFLQ